MSIISKTIPITVNDGIFLDPAAAVSYGAELNSIYTANTPFPHIVIDDFLPKELIEGVLAHFPASPTSKEVNYEKGYKGLHKRQIDPNECDAYLRSVFAFFKFGTDAAAF